MTPPVILKSSRLLWIFLSQNAPKTGPRTEENANTAPWAPAMSCRKVSIKKPVQILSSDPEVLLGSYFWDHNIRHGI